MVRPPGTEAASACTVAAAEYRARRRSPGVAVGDPAHQGAMKRRRVEDTPDGPSSHMMANRPVPPLSVFRTNLVVAGMLAALVVLILYYAALGIAQRAGRDWLR